MVQKAFVWMFLVLLSLNFIPSYGQTDTEELRLAVDILKGKDNTKDKTWALDQLLESQNYENDAFVQNVLGIAYLHGIGTDPDTVKAIAYFEQSGLMGYSPAYHNLGMYYKYADNGRQDFVKAYETFSKGAELDDPNCCYNTGYMKYKGLGCQQNYGEAFCLFSKAAGFNHAPSVYMLGLCYRNGYGVEADTAIGNILLRQSAGLGYEDAIEELFIEEPENNAFIHSAEYDETMQYPDIMPDIQPYLPLNNKVMTGSYQGFVVTYDWSGEHLISEKPLSVDMTVQRDTAMGRWIQGPDTIMFTAEVGLDGIFCFDSVEKDMYDRYSPDFTSRYRFEKVDMNYIRGFITGQLCLFSISEREPERPMYVSLHKTSGIEEDDNPEEFTKIAAFTDPYSHQITLKFELSQPVPSAQISIYDRTSVNVGNYTCGAMEAGINVVNFSPGLHEGYYVIYVVTEIQRYQTVIVI